MKKILAIDDNEINLILLNQIFRIHYPDYIFLKATSGREGIDLAIKEDPEIILLDILMPEMNGYEVCTYLKNDPVTRRIPILMISALGQNPQERTKGLNVGADAFISKPFSQDELRAQIDVVLRIKKAEDLLRKGNESLELLIKDQTTRYLQSEERYLQISEHALEFYWEFDSKGIFIYVSPVIEKILGEKPDTIIGEKSYISLFQLDDDKLKKSSLESSIREKDSFKDCEIELILKGNKKTWLSVSGFPTYDKNENYHGFRGVCYDITKRKQYEIALEKSIQQIRNYQKKLKKLNMEITLVEERERRRIAENLHDSLGQTLSLAFIKLSSVLQGNYPPNVQKTLNETSQLLNNAISESREITYDLSPPILYELGLIPAFKWKLEQIEGKYEIKTVLKGENQVVGIQKEFIIFLYRIVVELLNNVIKHADANLIELEVKKEKNFYYISVHDNGIGFTEQLKKKTDLNGGFGLMSITERLDSIKGRLQIKSELGLGTIAIVIVPTIEG